MKRIGPYALAFLGGLVIGAAAGAAVVATHWQRNFANWYVLQLADQANVAREIYAGSAAQLAESIRLRLPAYVGAVETEYRRTQGREWAYWIVADVYRLSGGSVPSELRPILASLPPRPFCTPPARREGISGAPR
jgi:hypothetical protein